MSAASLPRPPSTTPPSKVFLLRVGRSVAGLSRARNAVRDLGAHLVEFLSLKELLHAFHRETPSALLVAPSVSHDQIDAIRDTSSVPLIHIDDPNDGDLKDRLHRALTPEVDKNHHSSGLHLAHSRPDQLAAAQQVPIEKHFKAILDHAQEAIIATDREGKVLTWNRSAETLFACSVSQALGKGLDELGSGEFRRGVRNALEELQSEPRTSRELELASGDHAVLEASFSKVRDENGEWVANSVIMRDITERKRAEEALRQSERLATAGRMAATIAHELNNPLDGLKNLLYLLQNQSSLDHKAKELVELADREVNRMTFVTRQTLGFYRGASAPTSINLCQLVDELLALYQHKFANSSISVKKEYDRCNKVIGYPAELRQVISNLVVNAMEATGRDGSIHIRIHEVPDWTQQSGRGLRLLVADNGPGIPHKVQSTLFRPFFTTKGEKGTGLGLWVSKGIIKKHGGRISFRSSTRKGRSGTCFSIFLPYR